MKNKMLIGFIIAVVVVGGGAFYGGLLYGKSQATNARQQRTGSGQFGQAGQAGQQANRAARGGSNFVNGDIIAKDDKSITVKNQNGGSKIIFLSASTQISKFTAGNLTDLEIGQGVMASGATNSDGSLTAQMIQLRPPRPASPAGGPENASSTPGR